MSERHETVEWADLTVAQKQAIIDKRWAQGIDTDVATGRAIRPEDDQ